MDLVGYLEKKAIEGGEGLHDAPCLTQRQQAVMANHLDEGMIAPAEKALSEWRATAGPSKWNRSVSGIVAKKLRVLCLLLQKPTAELSQNERGELHVRVAACDLITKLELMEEMRGSVAMDGPDCVHEDYVIDTSRLRAYCTDAEREGGWTPGRFLVLCVGVNECWVDTGTAVNAGMAAVKFQELITVASDFCKAVDKFNSYRRWYVSIRNDIAQAKKLLVRLQDTGKCWDKDQLREEGNLEITDASFWLWAKLAGISSGDPDEAEEEISYPQSVFF